MSCFVPFWGATCSEKKQLSLPICPMEKPPPLETNFPRLATVVTWHINDLKNTSFPKICTTKSKWIPGFTVSHGFTAFYVTTKSTNLRHGLTKFHLSIYDSKWVAGVTAVWGLVFLYSKPTCSTCLMFFPGKSLNIMEFHGFSCVFSAFFRSFSPTEPSMIGCNGIVQNCSSLGGVPGPRSFLSAALSPDGF